MTHSSPAARGLDRFIPDRSSSNFAVFAGGGASAAGEQTVRGYEQLLRAELLGDRGHGGHSSPSSTPRTDWPRRADVLSFQSPVSVPRGLRGLEGAHSSPLADSSLQLLSRQFRRFRTISKEPTAILDAPSLPDDFYLNLLDWSSTDVLAVALGRSVFLWRGGSGSTTQLCDVEDWVTSVAWFARGSHLAVGTQDGTVRIYDAEKRQLVREMSGHFSRVVCLSWRSFLLSSGSRDRRIIHRDVRDRAHFSAVLKEHTQAVCGLQWSRDGAFLASGGNDNRLLVWSPTSTRPLFSLAGHSAAVRGVAWSPFQRGLLVSGGGTSDRTIRLWSALTGRCSRVVETGSQVCCLAWSTSQNELVSTHGYSLNQIILWDFQSLERIAVLSGHQRRVLHLAMRHDGTKIVTGAGDETLRFWSLSSRASSGFSSPSPLTMRRSSLR